MKVFLSWSGDLSKDYASALYDWLPTVIQKVKPYMSAETIATGERWRHNIAAELADTNYGVICLTPHNLNAPWIMFEGGALSKSVDGSRLTPLLFDLAPAALANTPLGQFQAVRFSKDGMSKLLNSMAAVGPDHERIGKDVLARSFRNGWTELEKKASIISARHRGQTKSTEPLINRSSRLPDYIQKSIISNALDVPFYYPKFSYEIDLYFKNDAVQYVMKLEFTMKNVSANQQSVVNIYPTTPVSDRIISATLNGDDLDLLDPNVVHKEGLTVRHRFLPETEAQFTADISRTLAPTNSELFTAYFYPAANFSFKVTNHSEDLLLAWIEGLHGQNGRPVRAGNMLTWDAKEPLLPNQGVRLLWRPK